VKPEKSLFKGWKNWPENTALSIIGYLSETKKHAGGVVRRKTISASMLNWSVYPKS